MRTLYSSVQNFKLSVILPVYANAFTYRYKECHYWIIFACPYDYTYGIVTPRNGIYITKTNFVNI